LQDTIGLLSEKKGKLPLLTIALPLLVLIHSTNPKISLDWSPDEVKEFSGRAI